ncbi:MAG TPA: DUF4159 domain-containing protein [Candidatus Methanoperedens sp.]|nr:DUF4159 domain-containing protein [Candidatus Methanoperedens sp.]
MKTRAAERAGRPAAPNTAAAGRRRFLRALAGAAAGLCLAGLRPPSAPAFSNYRLDPRDAVKRFVFAQLRHGGGWDPYPSAAAEFVRELERMTSVEADPERVDLALEEARLFSLPFLCLSGTRDFPPLDAAESQRLRTWLEAGGTLFADDAAGTPGFGFDAALRRELARALPGARLERLGPDHTVFKSFFLVRTVSGARIVSPFLEGITLQGRTAVVYSPNNLLGAFARDPLGRWVEPCAPGGERQRRLAFHLGVNVVLYALCGDYKQDRIHVPFLRQRS